MATTDLTLAGIATPEDAAAARPAPAVSPFPGTVALGAILLLAALLNFFQLCRVGYANSYYAAAVKSMPLSWHNFFFNAFDPGGFVTIDKPPLGFWFQVASAKLFGFSGVSLLLPEALAGVLSVALLYHLVRRFGARAGLLAALFLALTPVAVADNRNNTIDSILVLFLLLGAWASARRRAAPAGARAVSLRWLLLCAVFVGLGFNIKMLEAYLVVPAFGAGLSAGRAGALAHAAGASGAGDGGAAGRLALLGRGVDLTPASQRPWVDSTSTNSELDLAIGYNGLQRLLGRGGPGGPAGPASPALASPVFRDRGRRNGRPVHGGASAAGGTAPQSTLRHRQR